MRATACPTSATVAASRSSTRDPRDPPPYAPRQTHPREGFRGRPRAPGVIAGMSGSPIYVEASSIGALAYGCRSEGSELRSSRRSRDARHPPGRPRRPPSRSGAERFRLSRRTSFRVRRARVPRSFDALLAPLRAPAATAWRLRCPVAFSGARRRNSLSRLTEAAGWLAAPRARPRGSRPGEPGCARVCRLHGAPRRRHGPLATDGDVGGGDSVLAFAIPSSPWARADADGAVRRADRPSLPVSVVSSSSGAAPSSARDAGPSSGILGTFGARRPWCP